MRELQVKRLEAVIRAKEARLQGRQALGAAWAGGGRGGRPEAVRITVYPTKRRAAAGAAVSLPSEL